ncbi:MAG: transposase [Actinomycetota bacterium]
MTTRLPCPPAPGPLEAYATRFDPLFGSLAQRRGFRTYLAGLLLPRERNKTLTCLAGVEPVVGAQHPAVQRLQFFLSESTWDHEQVNARRLELLLADPVTAPHGAGVLVIDDAGDGKDGTATAHLGRQWLGRLGKTDRGLVTVTTLWADERCYYPLHAMPYTPAHHFPKGRTDPAFRTKLQLGVALAGDAQAAGVAFRAVVADCAYGDQDAFRGELATAGLAFVLALKRRRGVWAYRDQAHTPVDAARALAWGGPDNPGDWTAVARTFRDGHTATWWAADAQLGWWGPDGTTRLVVATTDPAALPETSTWYLATNLPRPGSPHAAHSPTGPPTWPSSCGATGSGTGSSSATSRSRTNWGGPTSRSAPMSPSVATRPWSTAPSLSVGRPPTLPTRCHPSPNPACAPTLVHRPIPNLKQPSRPSPRPRQGPAGPHPARWTPAMTWPVALGRVRAWLTPSTVLQHWWQAWSKAPPPTELQALITAVTAGQAPNLYTPV